jgi:deoxyribonuclease V
VYLNRVVEKMKLSMPQSWALSPKEVVALQKELRDQVVLEVPAGLRVERVAGLDVSASRRSRRGFAGITVLDARELNVVEEVGVERELTFPYIPGLLSFRELPLLAYAWERLETRPDVLIFDAHGLAHPRRFGIACHGGMLFGVPSIGVGKTILVGKYEGLGEARGSMAELVEKGEVIGMALRTRAGADPIFVSPGHRMDLETAVEIVLGVTPRYREPATTRRAHRLVNELRRASERGGSA